MKKLIAIMLMLCMILTLSACGQGTEEPAPAANTPAPSTPAPAATTTPAPATETEPAAEKVLVVRLNGEPPTLQPDTNSNDNAFSIAGNVFSQLVTLDANRETIPDLATSWETSEDGYHVTFHLHDDAYWHDGEKVTSDDVKYTFDYILTHDTCLMYARFTKYIESVDAPDDYTVVFNLKQYYAAGLIGRLGYYATFILPKHIFDNGQEWDENPASMAPIGCGPFKYDSTVSGVSITLVKNENYFGGAPNIDRLVYQIIPDAATAVQALYSGDIDFISNVPATEVEALLANPDYTMSLQTLPSPVYMLFNFKREALQDLALRQAIAMCVNREEICQKVYSGIRIPETHFYPSVISWVSSAETPAPDFNIEKAKQILEAAGYKADSEGYYVRGLVLDCYTTDSFPDVAKLLAASCAQAGIELTVNALEYQAWSDKVSGARDFDISLMGGFQGPDVSDLNGRVATGGASNYGEYSNSRVDELFDLGINSTDQAVRKPYYYEIQKILSEELPIVPIAQYSSYQVQASYVVDTPIQCAGRVSWNSYALTDIVE